MTITSTAFQNNEHIPRDYTCDGENINPPLTFSEVPLEAESLALIVEDPDAPDRTFTHRLIYDMSPGTLQLLQREKPPTGKIGTNDFGQTGYGGPCPPTGIHRYYFILHALSARPHLPDGASRIDVDTAIAGHILETAQSIGLYEKPTEPRKHWPTRIKMSTPMTAIPLTVKSQLPSKPVGDHAGCA